MAAPLPAGALSCRTVTDVPALHQLLRRAFQLSKTLPDELLHTFRKQVVLAAGLRDLRGALLKLGIQKDGNPGATDERDLRALHRERAT